MKPLLFVILAGLAAAALTQLQTIRQLTAQLGDDWKKLHPDVKRRALHVLAEANEHFAPKGLQVGIYDGWRDVKEQLQQIAEGDSKLKNPLNGYHPWGLAVDFVFIDRAGNWTWLPTDDNKPDPRWHELGAIIKRNGFEWGGEAFGAGFFDGPHAQLPILSTTALRTRYRDPQAFIGTFEGEGALI